MTAAILFTRLSGATLSDALALSWPELEEWLQIAVEIEKKING